MVAKAPKPKPAFIQVSGPYAEFGIAPDSTCVNDPVSFFVTQRFQYGELHLGIWRWV